MDTIEGSDSSIQIASAVTSYARILLHDLKLKISSDKTNQIMYCDTDSIVTSKPLNPNLLGSDIGMLKNEINELLGKNNEDCYFEEGIFLAPKTYMIKYKTSENSYDYKISFKGIQWDHDEITYF